MHCTGNLFKLLFLAAATFFLNVNIGISANLTVLETTGIAAITSDQESKARRNAIEDAIFLAALKIGADVEGSSISNDGILIRNVVKLDSRAQLVDFDILSEKNTGTHYKVKMKTFFAKETNHITTNCNKDKFPNISMFSPRIFITSNVDLKHEALAETVANAIYQNLELAYPGKITIINSGTINDLINSESNDEILDYSSLRKTKSVKSNSQILIEANINVSRKKSTLHHKIQISAYKNFSFEPLFTLKHTAKVGLPLGSTLSNKTPIRALNVLWPKDIKVPSKAISQIVAKINETLIKRACLPLEGKLLHNGEQLTLGKGSLAGVKKGDLAYLVSGPESWTLLRVTKVEKLAATLIPLNDRVSSKKLAGQTARILKGDY